MSVTGITDPEIENAVEEYLTSATTVDPIQVDTPVMGEWAEKFSREEPLCEANECDCDGHEHTAVSIAEPTTIIADEKPKLTDTEIRRLRRQFITVVYPRVAACGHKYVADKQPRHRNCADCWFAWLNAHGELIQTTDELHATEGGVQLIKDLQGSKFLKRFRQFMSTIARLKSWKPVPFRKNLIGKRFGRQEVLRNGK